MMKPGTSNNILAGDKPAWHDLRYLYIYSSIEP